MDQNNVVLLSWKEWKGEREMETARRMNTLHTFYSEISLQSDFIIWHRFRLILCFACLCESERFWKYFCTIYQTISRGYARHFPRLQCIKKCIISSTVPYRSQINHEISMRREYVREIKIIFELLNRTTALFEIMTSFRLFADV